MALLFRIIKRLLLKDVQVHFTEAVAQSKRLTHEHLGE